MEVCEARPNTTTAGSERRAQMQRMVVEWIFNAVICFPREICCLVAAYCAVLPVRWSLAERARRWAVLSDDAITVSYPRSFIHDRVYGPFNGPFWIEVFGDSPLSCCSSQWTVRFDSNRDERDIGPRTHAWIGVAHRTRFLTKDKVRRVEISMHTLSGALTLADDTKQKYEEHPTEFPTPVTITVDPITRRVSLKPKGLAERHAYIPESDCLDDWFPTVQVGDVVHPSHLTVVD